MDIKKKAKDILEREALRKSQNKDWQKEGIYLQAEPFDSEEHFKGFSPKKHDFMIAAYANKAEAKKRGEIIGYANLQHTEKGLYPHSIKVHQDHQRKGIATAMYKMAEDLSGRKIVKPKGEQSQSAKKLWSQRNRPFGKSELAKGQKGNWKKEGITLSHKTEDAGHDYTRVIVRAHHPEHGLIGEAKFIYSNLPGKTKTVQPSEIGIDKRHHRKGLGTAMYQHVEKVTGKRLILGDDQSDEAIHFWNQPNRPFGKPKKKKP
jgi:GNAT superfamily N-acetyltransferase